VGWKGTDRPVLDGNVVSPPTLGIKCGWSNDANGNALCYGVGCSGCLESGLNDDLETFPLLMLTMGISQTKHQTSLKKNQFLLQSYFIFFMLFCTPTRSDENSATLYLGEKHQPSWLERAVHFPCVEGFPPTILRLVSLLKPHSTTCDNKWDKQSLSASKRW